MLPPHQYQFACQHPQLAMEMLEEELTSDDLGRHTNAYDFMIRLARVPAVKERALGHLRGALRGEGGMTIRHMVEPFLPELLHEMPTSRGAVAPGQ
jgi:hypothetical protein